MNREKFSSLLIELRKEKNLTQQEFSELFSISFQAVSKWETGESLPDITTLEKISHFYNITINDLLNGNKVFIQEAKKEEPIYDSSNPINNNSNNRIVSKKINIVKLIFSSVFLFLFLVFCSLPSIDTDQYIVISIYKIIFSNNYSNFNYLFLFAFLSVIASCTLGILSSILRNISKTLTSIETPLMIFSTVAFVIFTSIFSDYILPFYIFFCIVFTIYTVCLVVVKKLNENCILTKNQRTFNVIPLFVIHLYLLIVMISNMSQGLFISLLVILAFIINIGLLILQVTLKRNILVIIFSYFFFILLTMTSMYYLGSTRIVFGCIFEVITYILLNVYEMVSTKKINK